MFVVGSRRSPPTAFATDGACARARAHTHTRTPRHDRVAPPEPPQVSRVFVDVDDKSAEALEVLPLGRYCADIASDAATTFLAAPVEIEDMPEGDVELQLFDELS